MKRENTFQIIDLFALLFAQEVRISNKLACIQVVQIVLYDFSFMVDVHSVKFILNVNSFYCTDTHFKLVICKTDNSFR